MNNRIKEIRNNFGLTQQEFADRIKVKRNTVATYEMGRSTPSDSAIALMCKEFSVNEEWLRTGSGEPYKKRNKSQEIGYFANEIMDLPDENFKKRFISALAKLDERDWNTLAKIADELSKEG